MIEVALEAVLALPSPFTDHCAIEQIDYQSFCVTGVSTDHRGLAFLRPIFGDLASSIFVAKQWASDRKIKSVQIYFKSNEYEMIA